MSKPMTVEEAVEAFPEDTDSQTCSMRCGNCDKRVYFQGDRHDQPYSYICPYCKDRTFNILVLEKRKRIEELLETIRQTARL